MHKPVFIYAITFVVAACSLLYELLIAQAVTLLSANAVTRYSVTVGLFLGAMGLGALLCSRIFGRMKAWHALLRVELVLTALGGAAVMVIAGAHIVFMYAALAGMSDAGSAAFFAAVFAVIVLIGFFTGLELPLLIRIGNESSPRNLTNRVLAADYFGSLAAGIAFPLVLLPRWELPEISFATALLNAAVAALILCALGKGGASRFAAWAVTGACAAALLAGIAGRHGLQQYFLKRYYYYHEFYSRIPEFTLMNYLRGGMDFPDVERISSPYQKIDIVQQVSYGDPFTFHLIDAYSRKYVDDPGFPRNKTLFLNGDYQFWTDFEEVYHEYFVHVPVMVAGRVPEDVLVLGAGDGLLLRELLKYPGVRRITLVELDPKMLELARTHPVFVRANGNALSDPRVSVVAGDAYHFVRNAADRRSSFDAVYIDFPDPNDYNLAKLYSREFYGFVRSLLKPDGYIVLDAPGINVSPDNDAPAAAAADAAANADAAADADAARGRELWRILDDTLAEAGFGARLPYFSVLERDNERARDIVRRLLAGYRLQQVSPGGQSAELVDNEEAVDFIISHYVSDLKSEFIMARIAPGPFAIGYRDPGFAFSVLNERRFELAFVPQDKLLRAGARKKVNSIARPLLPNNSFWWIRLPY